MIAWIFFSQSSACHTFSFLQNMFIALTMLNWLDPMAFSGYLIQAFEVLSKRLRLIQDIPLKVSSVQPLDSGTVSFLRT